MTFAMQNSGLRRARRKKNAPQESNHQNIILPAIIWFVPNKNMFGCLSWRETSSPYSRRTWVPRSASPTHTSSAGRTSARAQTLEHTDQKSLVINIKHFISFHFMRVCVCARTLQEVRVQRWVRAQHCAHLIVVWRVDVLKDAVTSQFHLQHMVNHHSQSFYVLPISVRWSEITLKSEKPSRD